jgi:hypothetical protein
VDYFPHGEGSFKKRRRVLNGVNGDMSKLQYRAVFFDVSSASQCMEMPCDTHFLEGKIMQKAVLLMGFGLILNSSAALAAAPVFQLHAQDAGGRLSAVDAFSPRIERESIFRSVQTPYAGRNGSSGSAEIIPVSLSRNAGGEGDRPLQLRRAVALSTASARDSLFYFAKNFKPSPLQKPERWTMLLAGLCFLLYQVRRRPMRSSIAFHVAGNPLGRHGG